MFNEILTLQAVIPLCRTIDVLDFWLSHNTQKGIDVALILCPRNHRKRYFALESKSQSYQTFFFLKQRFFPFFAIKLGHFKVHTIFYSAINTQA